MQQIQDAQAEELEGLRTRFRDVRSEYSQERMARGTRLPRVGHPSDSSPAAPGSTGDAQADQQQTEEGTEATALPPSSGALALGRRQSTRLAKCACATAGAYAGSHHLMTCPLLGMIFIDVEQQYRDMKEAQRATKNYWSNSLAQRTNEQMRQLRSYIQ